MKVILFDLGNTLVDNNGLIAGAKDTLSAINAMHDSNGDPPVLALISDYDMVTNAIDVKPVQIRYYKELENLKIGQFFQPYYKHVTLSTEIGVNKPVKRIFRFAIDTIKQGLPFGNVLFITENPLHIQHARSYGMKAIHFKGPGQNVGEVANLLDLVPRVQSFLNGENT